MSHTIVRPPATTQLRRWLVATWDDPDSRSTTIGVAAVVLFHLLLWIVGPRVLRFEALPMPHRPHADGGKNYNIELSPESILKPAEKPVDPSRFVETNPEAPENTPDKTVNFGAQNQQVAQEKPTPDGKSDRPATEGKKDIESNQIVSGRLSDPLENLQAIPPTPAPAEAEQAVTAQQQRAEQNPLAGFEKKEGDNQDAVGTNVAPQVANAKAIPEKIEGGRDVPIIEGATGLQAAVDPKRPKPRPQLMKTVQARPAVLTENKFGTTNIGNVAYDAKWSNYGAYLQRMINTVQVQWERIIVQWNANPSIGSVVTVKFVLDADGKIAQIVNVETNANETATRACISAITDRAPYGEWTDDMRAVLGQNQELTFTFYYQ